MRAIARNAVLIAVFTTGPLVGMAATADRAEAWCGYQCQGTFGHYTCVYDNDPGEGGYLSCVPVASKCVMSNWGQC